eukprot:m.509709 g.509709  ORF g.509709 m.509709 type:complete len:82 (-) comp94538_c0_seq1:12-257(-)
MNQLIGECVYLHAVVGGAVIVVVVVVDLWLLAPVSLGSLSSVDTRRAGTVVSCCLCWLLFHPRVAVLNLTPIPSASGTLPY